MSTLKRIYGNYTLAGMVHLVLARATAAVVGRICSSLEPFNNCKDAFAV
tara:strand:+ start:973 stop:1119 length:147 start_codon:yes stop_codon:yes gene_type:complete